MQNAKAELSKQTNTAPVTLECNLLQITIIIYFYIHVRVHMYFTFQSPHSGQTV